MTHLRTLSVLAVIALCCAIPVQAATILVEENFGGDGTNDLKGTTADTFHADLILSGGSDTFGGSLNVEDNGDAYGNNAKVTYLNLGSYIDDTKGTADGLFELSFTMAIHTTRGDVGPGYNFLGFSNTASPAFADNSHQFAAVGTNGNRTSLAYTIEPDLDNSSFTSTTAGTQSLSISIDLTPTHYDGTTKFGLITLTDSDEGILTSGHLISDQSFAAISFTQDGLFNNRTGSRYGSLTLTQIEVPEPASLLMGLAGLTLIAGRRRR
jgi:hypothetical protein